MRSLHLASLFFFLGACSSRPPLPPPVLPLVPTPIGALPSAPPMDDSVEDAPLPVARQYRLDSGLTVRHLQREGWPLTTVYLVSARGGRVYPRNQAGLSRLANHALIRAADHGLSGVDLSVTTSGEAALLGASMRPDRVARMLEAVGRAVTAASPSDEIIEGVRLSQLNRMRDYQRGSVAAAQMASLENLYGARHHLAGSPYGNVEVVADTSPDDVRAAIARRWSPSSSALVVVGDIGADELDPLVATAFADFVDRPGESPTIPALGERPPRSVLAFHDGDEACYVLLSDYAPRIDADDSLAFSALMKLAAGHFSSRINQSLRIRHTMTYGAHASYTSSRFAGTYSLDMTVPSEDVEDALEILVEEVRNLQQTPPTETELARVKGLLESSLRAALDENSSTAARLAYGWVRGEPEDLFTERVAAIRALTSEQIQAASLEWLRPGDVPVVVAGDLNVIRPRRNLDQFGHVQIFTFQFEDD